MAITRKTQQKPSAKQLAARKKFAAAAKARSKAAKKPKAKNTQINYVRVQQLKNDIAEGKGHLQAKSGYWAKPEMKVWVRRTIADAEAKLKKEMQGIDTRQSSAKNPRKRNKTIIVKPKRVVVLNGKATRRKYRNGYLDLVIRGTAEKTASGWKVGKKVIAQGKGIAPISSGYYLDKSTGTVFAKRVRNSDHRDADHPIEVTKHWRQGPPGYLTQWQRAHHAGQQGLFDHGIKPAKKRNSSAKASPATRAIREKFTGTKSRKTATMNASNGTPKNLAKLGKLVLIKTANGTIKPGNGITWLCADAKGKLHLATSAARLVEGPARNFGEVSQIEYEARKPHLGYKNQTIFFHKMGEEGGKKPVLIADGKGGLKLRGGSYRIEREGIVD